MLCEVRSLGLSGISGYEVRAECDLSAGLPAFEQFDGVGQMNLTQAVEIDQGENRQEKEQRTLKGGEGEFKAQGNSAVEQAEQQEVH